MTFPPQYINCLPSMYDNESMYDNGSCTSENWSNKNKKTMSEINLPFEIDYSTSKNNIYWSDDESVPFNYDDDTISTVSCNNSDTSVGNASIDTLKVYQLEADELEINYRGPKVLPENETPATICTANTIGLLHSRKLLRVLFDSGSNACLIK